uniref:ADP-ribosyl cyclase/cyclic ADP-ribose hydrolase n=1 Tax=Lotus japonicus TaxID=34305 RepID=I3SBT0_LOTJA|nr:unknown [Lotus japonicus]
MSSSSTNIANLESIIDRVFFSYTLADIEVEPFISLLHKKLSIPTCCFDNINKVKGNPPRREIKGSGVSVVVFSERYGGSSRCHRVQGQVVLPVFFGVDVCDVREQKGIFGQEFELMVKRRSVEEDTVLTWRKALSEIASFTGYSAPPDRFRYDPHLKYYIDSFDQLPIRLFSY